MNTARSQKNKIKKNLKLPVDYIFSPFVNMQNVEHNKSISLKIWQKNLMITTILDNSIFLPYQGESLNN